MILVDQRNHGNSANLDLKPPHTMHAAAQDLVNLVQQRFHGQQISVIAGHSLGGKTTLEFLQQVSKGRTGLSNPHQVCALQMHLHCTSADAAFACCSLLPS